jgi:hypothetical protein
MSHTMRSFVASLALLAAAACASAPKLEGGDGASAEQGALQPPERISGGPWPELRVPSPTAGRVVVARMDIQVMVDEKGDPDLSTFRAIGPGSELNQDALRSWISSSRFRPGRRNGQPVRALFRTVIEGRRR